MCVHQELVNLLLGGRAVSNVFDNDMELDSGNGNMTLLKGVKGHCDVGLMSLFEHYNICRVSNIGGWLGDEHTWGGMMKQTWRASFVLFFEMYILRQQLFWIERRLGYSLHEVAGHSLGFIQYIPCQTKSCVTYTTLEEAEPFGP